MTENRFPSGWDEKKVQQVLNHYEHQTEEEAIAEDEAAYDDDKMSMVEIPNELIETVRNLIAQHQSQS